MLLLSSLHNILKTFPSSTHILGGGGGGGGGGGVIIILFFNMYFLNQ